MPWLRFKIWVCLQAAMLLLISTAASRVVQGQESDQATRQFAVAVGFQNQKLYDSAIEEWQAFIAKFPQDPRLDKASHYLGTCQLQAKQYPASIASFEKVLAAYPKFELLDQTILNLGTAWYSIAQESKKSEDYAKAEAGFTKVLSEFPKSQFAGRARFYNGESLYHQNKLKEASENYAAFIREFPKDELLPDAMYALGVSQEAQKLSAEAQSTYTAFEGKFPQHPLLTEVRMRSAESLFADRKFAEAQKLFSLVAAVKEFSLADTAMLRQGRCAYELGKYEDAGAIYWNVPREFPKTKSYDTAVLAGAKCYFLAGKYTLARTGLENVAKRDVPEAAEASQWIGRSLLRENKPADALTVLDAAIAKHPASPALPQLLLARIDALYEIPDRRAETVPLYAEFAQKYPAEDLAAQARYMAALTALDLGNHAAAKTNSDEFLKQFPNDKLLAGVQFIGAEARLLLKEFEEAEKFYQAFIAANPAHSNVMLARLRSALALQLGSKPDAAMTQLETFLNEVKDPALKSEALAIAGRCRLAKEELEKAADAFEKSLKAMPNREQSDETLLILADVYRRLNQPAESMARLNQLKKDFPKSGLTEEATFRLGDISYAQNDFALAATHYTSVVSNWPKGTFAPHAQYGLTWCYFKNSEFAKSIEAAGVLKENYSTTDLAGKALYVRAMGEFQLGQFAEAADDAGMFLKTNPSAKETLDAQYLLGLAQAGLQKFADAAKTYAAILASDPQYPDADKVLYELGWSYLELGQQAESVAAFQRLGNEYPQSPLAVESLFRVGESLYEAGKFTEAAKVYAETQAKAGAGEMGEKAAHKLAWSYFKSDRFPEAAEAFSGQLKVFPTGALAGDASFLLGECFYKQQQWKPAMAEYAKVISAKNLTYEALAIYRSGECAVSLEQWDQSLKFFQQVLARFPDFELKSEARYGAGWSLQQQQKLEEAMSFYEKVTEETDTETAAKARFMIGECCFAQKKHKEASKHFLKAAFAYGHKEWSAMAWFEAARCFEVLKDVDQAKNCYQQMIEKFPEHSKIADAKKRLAEL